MLNYSTDGVSREVKSNFDQQCLYLSGKSSQLSMPDPIHNLKNVCYQLVGGSGGVPAVIGNHMFHFLLLKMSGITRELVRVDDFAFNDLVLCLAYPAVVKMLLDLNTAHLGIS